jgi:EAL and modified HD-GYP domain-containing signal transduction protein
VDRDSDDALERISPPPTDGRTARAAWHEGSDITLRNIPSGFPPRPALGPAPASAIDGVDWLDTFIDELTDGNSSVSALKAGPGSTSLPTEFVDLSIGRSAARVLGQVLLGYSPVIDPVKGVIATRLTVVPVRAGAAIDAGALLEALAEVWPAEGDPVMLNLASESLLTDVLRARPSLNVLIEVPAFVAASASNTRALQQLAARGSALLLKGRPLSELPREVLPCFRWSIIDRADDRRDGRIEPPRGAVRTIPFIQSGVRTMAELRDSFARGAVAVLGWPLNEPIAGAFEARPDTRVVLDALQRLDQGDSLDSVDHVLMRDPVLALELLQLVNTEAADLSVEARSMRHAVSMLGTAHLRRWLARLLGRSSDDIALRPANFAALRRGLLMRMLAAGAGQRELRGELFMCGVFSLLDCIYARPIGELLRELALPERVRAALVDRSGPHRPLLDLARAVESELPHDIRAASEAVFVQPMEINRALLRSLLAASHLERPAAAPPAAAHRAAAATSPR